MPTAPRTFRSNAVRTEARDDRRGSARARGYDGKWEKARAAHLRGSPLCRYCETGAFGQSPCVTAATLVDHLYPHGGDRALFWLTAYWVSSCSTCHSRFKQAAEHAGRRALDALARHLGLPPLGEGGGPKSGAPS